MWGDKPWALSKEDEEGLLSYKKQLKELQRCDQEVFYTPNEQPFTAEHLCVDGIRESEEYGLWSDFKCFIAPPLSWVPILEDVTCLKASGSTAFLNDLCAFPEAWTIISSFEENTAVVERSCGVLGTLALYHRQMKTLTQTLFDVYARQISRYERLANMQGSKAAVYNSKKLTFLMYNTWRNWLLDRKCGDPVEVGQCWRGMALLELELVGPDVESDYVLWMIQSCIMKK